jgi:hypothetical protein
MDDTTSSSPRGSPGRAGLSIADSVTPSERNRRPRAHPHRLFLQSEVVSLPCPGLLVSCPESTSHRPEGKGQPGLLLCSEAIPINGLTSLARGQLACYAEGRGRQASRVAEPRAFSDQGRERKDPPPPEPRSLARGRSGGPKESNVIFKHGDLMTPSMS